MKEKRLISASFFYIQFLDTTSKSVCADLKQSKKNMSNQVKMPSGIPYIIGNEAAERFSYYGMKAILMIFMTDYLQMSDAIATTWLHNFGSAVYAFPLIGALVADMFFGKYKTILSLSLVYCLGHLVLALYETQEGLLAGLTLIAIGSGGIKPCVSAHVGDQFTDSNKSLISTVFSYFYLSINLGATLSSLLIPFLLDDFGPSIAFGIPGALMFIATIVFWLGRNDFVHIPASGPREVIDRITSKEGLSAIGRLSIVYLFVSIFWALFDQTGSTWVIQAKTDLLDKTLNVFGLEITLLPSQIQAANPILILILVPIFTIIVYPLLGRVVKLTAMKKVLIGMFVASLSFFIVAYAEEQIYNGETVSVSWQLLAYLVLTAAEVMISITVLEFSYTQAPNEIKSIIMSVYLLSVSLGNYITSAVNSWMIQEVKVEAVSINEKLPVISFEEIEKAQTGDKLSFEGKNGMEVSIVKDDSTVIKPLEGTFLLGNQVSDKDFELWDIHRKPLLLQGAFDLDTESKVTTYKLNGASYFNFFAYLMGGTALLFIVVAFRFKEKAYIQGSNSNDEHSEIEV